MSPRASPASGTTHDITASDTATGTINNDDSVVVNNTPEESGAGITIEEPGQIGEDDSGLTITFDDANTNTDEVSSQSTKIGGVEEVIEGSSKKVTVSYSRPPPRIGTIPPVHVRVSILRPPYGKNRVDSADFSVSPGKVKLENNSSAQWTITAIADNVVEPKREVSLMRIEKWNSAGTRINYVLTQSGPHFVDTSTATVTVSNASASEGDAITFTLKLDNAVVGGFKVKPQYTNGTAIGDKGADKDYSRNGKEIAFAGTAGETKTFTVSTKEDDIVEHDETFTVGLRVLDTSLSVNTGTATGTIKNDDYAKVAATHTAAKWIDEGDQATYTVKLDKKVQDSFKTKVRFTTDTNPGTARFGTDFISYTSVLTFAGTAGETKTFQVSTIEDEDVELHEPFNFWFESKTVPDGVTLEEPHPSVIRNDDHATLTVSDANANEGESMTFTVKLDKAVPGGLTVTPTYTNGTTANSDYTKNLTALSFSGTAGETKTFTVSTTEDTEVEANETFTVGTAVSKTSLSVINTDTGTGTINDDESAAVTINDASANEGSDITFTVTLNKAVPGGLTVTPSYTNGIGTTSADYTKNTTAITFAGTANETKTFTVQTTQDTDPEADETFTVGLTVSKTSHSVTATDTGTGTINNDDIPRFTVTNASASEGDKITFTATLDRAVPGGLKVTPLYRNGTASSADYTKNKTTITFSGTANESHTFTVQTTEDTSPEANETFRVGCIVSETYPFVINSNMGIGTINDDDAGPKVTVSNASASEGDAISFTLTLDQAVTNGFTATPTYTNGTTASTDYTTNTTAITFSGTANESKTFTVQTTEDDIVEHNETFTVDLTITGTNSVVGTETGTGTINDDDTATLTISSPSASEGGSMTFTVTLDNAVSGGLRAEPSYFNQPSTDTATKGTDYTANTTNLTFTGTANESKTFTVQTTQDTDVESNETFRVGLNFTSTLNTNKFQISGLGTGTITNDDKASVTVSDASAEEGESMTFTVTLNNDVPGELVLLPTYNVLDTDTATKGTDYTANTPNLTFSGTANESKTFTVQTTEDTSVESDETFLVGLNTPNAYDFHITGHVGTGTITNDDHSASVTISDAIAEEGNSMTFNLALNNTVSGGFTVTPSYTNVTAASTDYTANTTAITFNGTKGETKTLTVQTTEDTTPENAETFTVNLAVSNNTVSATDTGKGTITNDDDARLTVSNASAEEGESMTFTVTLNKAVQGNLVVQPLYVNLTAASNDYTKNTDAITFTGTANESHTFTVQTTEDTDIEPDETFTVNVSTTSASSILNLHASSAGTSTITNDDWNASVTINDASADEGDSMTFTVTLDKAVSGGLTVTPSYTNGTAASTDYTANTTALSFTGNANETKTFTVSTTEDTDVEANETFTVNLTVSNTTVSVGATDTGTGTITDDDDASLTVSKASVEEGESMTFTVTLNNNVQGNLVVQPDYFNITASDADYTKNTTAITFTGTANESHTFTVQTTEDNAVEPDETFVVNVGIAPKSSILNLHSSNAGASTITNDDAYTAALTINNARADEGESMTFTITLDKAVSGGLTVTPSYTNVTASDADYTKNTTAINFTGTAGETKTFTVQTTEDDPVEADETFTVGLTASGTSHSIDTSDTGTGTIRNDEWNQTLSITNASASEGDAITFTLTLTNAVSGGFSVNPTFTDGTATGKSGKGKDFQRRIKINGEYASVVTFAGTAGETQTFTVGTKEDEVVEHDETFSVSGRVTGANGVGVGTGTGTITNDDNATVTLTRSWKSANIHEGDRGNVTATLDKAVQGGFTTTVKHGSGTNHGTAKIGTDYSSNTTTLTFAGTANEQKTIPISTIEDAVVELHETISIWLDSSDKPEDVTLESFASAIGNDDIPTLTVSDASADEGESITFTVTLDKDVTAADTDGFTVTPSFTDGTAIEGTDYDENTTTLSFTGTANESHTFTVSTTEDQDAEANETFTVGLTLSGMNTRSSTLQTNGHRHGHRHHHRRRQDKLVDQ